MPNDVNTLNKEMGLLRIFECAGFYCFISNHQEFQEGRKVV